LKLAKLFGAPVIIDSTIRDGSLRACGMERGVPILVYEAGEALRFHEVSIRAGLRGVLNIMRHLGMLPPLRKAKAMVPVIADSTSWVRAPESGIVSRKVKLGARVVEGQRLASISDPLGEGEEGVIAPFDGIVIGHSTLPLAHEGDALFHVGAFKSVARAENKVEEFHARHTG
jgi:predicted deacylase